MAGAATSEKGHQVSSGLRCPKCNCPDLRAWVTRNKGETRSRVRICRHCGHRVLTKETIIGNLSNTGRKPKNKPKGK
jgi:DNA-directed RNA polymerase subunit RPC12/RpoP